MTPAGWDARPRTSTSTIDIARGELIRELTGMMAFAVALIAWVVAQEIRRVTR